MFNIDFVKIKKYLLYTLVGCLVVSAVVAVIAVLIGDFNDITAKTFFTLLAAFIHALIGLLFVWDEERAKKYNILSFFVNTLFFIVILSFITNVFGIWDIIPDKNVGKMYFTYLIAIFASLHADILSKATGKEKYIDSIVNTNYIFIAIVFLMFQPIIHLHDPETTLGSFYFRLLAASGIIDGTLSVLTIIFHKLYWHKHPELKKADNSDGLTGWGIAFIIIFCFFFFLYAVGSITHNYYR